MSRVAGADAQIQRHYESGALSYPRTLAGPVSAAGRAAVEGWGVRVSAVAPAAELTVRRPHDPLMVYDAHLPGVVGGVPQHLLPESSLLLDRVARAMVRAAVDLPIERPETSGLPAWAQDLAWWRPSPDAPRAALSQADGCGLHAEAMWMDLDADEIALVGLLEAGLGRPSSLADHAHRAAERGFVGPEGLTELGAEVISEQPPSLREPGLAQAVEAVIDADRPDAPSGVPADLIERCFDLMPELAPSLRRALAGGEDGGGAGDLRPEDPIDALAQRRGADGETDTFWRRLRRRRAQAGAPVEGEASPGMPAPESAMEQPQQRSLPPVAEALEGRPASSESPAPSEAAAAPPEVRVRARADASLVRIVAGIEPAAEENYAPEPTYRTATPFG